MFSKADRQQGNWLYLLVAFLLALGLWYTLNAREEIERVIEVRLDYKGLPAGLIVTDGQINKVSVRVRGPKELLRSMTNREISYTMNLANVTPGKNLIPLTSGDKPPELRAYDVLEVIPSRIILEVDKLVEASLPVKVLLRATPFSSSLRLRDVIIEPAQVTVRGPVRVLATLKEIQAEVPVDFAAEDTAFSEEIPLLAPSTVEITPQVAKVTWKMDVRRRTLSLQRDVIFESENPAVGVQPSRVNLMVSVPQALVRDTGYLAQFQIAVPTDTVVPAGDESVKATLQVAAPPGGRVLKVSPETVVISRHTTD